MKLLIVILVIALSAVAPRGFAADKTSSFEGTINATLTRTGTEATQFVFTRKGNVLRIENTSDKLDAVNIVDLDANKLTIIYPHNTTFVRLDLTRAQPVAGVGDPGSVGLSGMPMPPGPGSAIPATTPHVGPSISPPPGLPSPPPMPSVPEMPSGRMPNGAGKMPALPNPMMMPPPMPGMFGAAELKKTDKTKKIQGFYCTLYTIEDRGQKFEIWATDDSALFPFRLIQHDYTSRSPGPQALEEQWPELLQKRSLFPLEATLKIERGGQERLSFKIEKIDKRKIDNDALFVPPEKYIEINRGDN